MRVTPYVSPSLRTRLRLPAVGTILFTLMLVLISLVVIAPVAFTISTSLRTPIESFNLPPQWIPTKPVWDNYQAVFTTIPFEMFIFNSAIVTGCIVVGQVITAALAGYAFGCLQFPGRDVLFWLVLATLMIPIQATIIPVFVLISKMGLADTRSSLILPALTTAFGTFLLRQYFMRIPKEYEESAVIDGANQLQIFASIYLPLVRPGLAVLAILTFNSTWNDFIRPLIFLNSVEKFTLPLGLVSLSGYMGSGSISVVLAGVVISLIPVLIVYLIGQRYLIEGLMVGGLKG